jgi:hypothetical protein
MTRQFLLIWLATSARTLIEHACVEALRLALEYTAPGIPPIFVGIGLALGVTLVETAATLWHPGTEGE